MNVAVLQLPKGVAVVLVRATGQSDDFQMSTLGKRGAENCPQQERIIEWRCDLNKGELFPDVNPRKER
jgi:hypothetical protein